MKKKRNETFSISTKHFWAFHHFYIICINKNIHLFHLILSRIKLSFFTFLIHFFLLSIFFFFDQFLFYYYISLHTLHFEIHTQICYVFCVLTQHLFAHFTLYLRGFNVYILLVLVWIFEYRTLLNVFSLQT